MIASKTRILDRVETATDFAVSNLDLRNGGRDQDRKGHIRSIPSTKTYMRFICRWKIVLRQDGSWRLTQARSILRVKDRFGPSAAVPDPRAGGVHAPPAKFASDAGHFPARSR